MKKTIDLSKEALAIYDKWGYKKSENVSQAIIEFEKKEQGQMTLTEADRQWVMDRITEAVHACYKP